MKLSTDITQRRCESITSLFCYGRIPLYLILIALLYKSTFIALFKTWSGDNYNYCYFIPAVTCYLLWDKRGDLRQISTVSSWAGLYLVVPSLGLYWLGELGGEYYTLYLSLWLLVSGLCLLHLGWPKLKAVAFPLCFSLAAFPLPSVIYNNASLHMKLLSSRFGVWLLRLGGIEAYREGNIIDLGFTRLQVVDACSGLRYLVPLLILSVLLAHFYRGPFWQKSVLVASTLPLAVATNGLRIALVGYIYPIFGAQVAEGFFHDFSGWLIFVAALTMLLGEIWLFCRVFPARRGGIEPAEAIAPEASKSEVGPARPISRSWAQFTVVTVMLIASLLLLQSHRTGENIPLARSLVQFPLDLGAWQGTRIAMERGYRDALKLSDYLLADYRNRDGELIGLYVAYNDSQRKGASTHSPGSCLPGSGWTFQESGAALLPVKLVGNRPVQVNRALIQKSGERMLVYYWFPQRGRMLTSMLQLKFYLFWDALTRERTDGAMVRVITPVYPSEGPDRAEARLASFTCKMLPLLQEFIPN